MTTRAPDTLEATATDELAYRLLISVNRVLARKHTLPVNHPLLTARDDLALALAHGEPLQRAALTRLVWLAVRAVAS